MYNALFGTHVQCSVRYVYNALFGTHVQCSVRYVYNAVLNDMHKCVSPGTNIALYADDTKIWRKIESPEDHVILQNDINALLRWSVLNKMNFHPDKCHVVKVTLKRDKCVDFTYRLGITDLEYVSVEKDLGSPPDSSGEVRDPSKKSSEVDLHGRLSPLL